MTNEPKTNNTGFLTIDVNSSNRFRSWVCHVFGFDEGVEFFGGDEAEFDGGIAEADAGVMSGFGDFGGVVVADFGGERGDEHQGILHVAVDLRAIQFDAD